VPSLQNQAMLVFNRITDEASQSRSHGRCLTLIHRDDFFRRVCFEEAVIVVVDLPAKRLQRETFILTFGRDVGRDDGGNMVDGEIRNPKLPRQGDAQLRFAAARWATDQIEHVFTVGDRG
jgi:hypothetical protein